MNLENTLLMIEDTINGAKGLLGKSLAVEVHDTHGDIMRGQTETQTLLGRNNLFGVIGPEEPQLATQIATLVQSKNVTEILPGDAAPTISDPTMADLWFRTGPSTYAVAGALVDQLKRDAIHRVVILFEPDSYGEEMNRLIVCQFQAAVRGSALSLPLVGSISAIVAGLAQDAYDAIVLVAYPVDGARVVSEQALLGAAPASWYLAPPLDSPAFIQNVPPSALAHAVGISPAENREAADFAAQYKAQWNDTPLTSSYYYYDAAAIWALALEAAAHAGGGAAPPAQAVATKLRDVSAATGETIAWNQLAHGLELVRQGSPVSYTGLTGPLHIGASDTAGQNLLRFWSVPNGAIQYHDAFNYSQSISAICLNQP